jgi:hypothetical protein
MKVRYSSGVMGDTNMSKTWIFVLKESKERQACKYLKTQGRAIALHDAK